MLRDEIINTLKKYSGSKQVHLETPENQTFGDYASNIALVQAQGKSINPKKLAVKMVSDLKKDKKLGKIVSRIEVWRLQ